MSIVTPTISVRESESFEQDLLRRSDFGENLLNLVSFYKSELVISLDGEWGEGKTTLVKMWQGLLNNNDIPNIYMDAFEKDYVDDAFISIASIIAAYIDENTDNKSSDFKEKATRVAVSALSWTAKVGIKAATLGAIKDSDIDELNDIKNDLSKGISSIASDFISERLSSHTKEVELLSSFKKTLSEIPSLLNNNTDKPLVIIIDELDRCKPTYAVELIEKIKHLFSVENVVFVLVMNRKQLEESIKCVYGQAIDAHTYLQKFIHIESKLPKIISHPYNNDISLYNKKLFDNAHYRKNTNLLECMDRLANHFDLTLRQLEKVHTNITVYYLAFAQGHLDLPQLVSFLAIVKVVNPTVYERLSLKSMTYNELRTATNLPEDNDKNYDSMGAILRWLKFPLLTDLQFEALNANDHIRKFANHTYDKGLDRGEVIPFFTQKLNMFTTA